MCELLLCPFCELKELHKKAPKISQKNYIKCLLNRLPDVADPPLGVLAPPGRQLGQHLPVEGLHHGDGGHGGLRGQVHLLLDEEGQVLGGDLVGVDVVHGAEGEEPVDDLGLHVARLEPHVVEGLADFLGRHGCHAGGASLSDSLGLSSFLTFLGL